MADEEKKEQNEAGEESPKKSGGIKKIIMIWVPLFILQLGLSYVIVAKVFKKKAIQQDVVAAEAPKKKKKKKPEKPGEIYLVEDVIANPKNTLGRHFVNLTVGLEEGDPKVGDLLKNREAQVRDVLIDILVGKTIEQIDDVEDKEQLKKEIKARLNKLLGDDSIRNVYFSNFIIQ